MIPYSARAYVAGAAALLIVSGAGLLYWNGRHDGAAAEKPKTELAADNGAARGLEVQGAQETTHRVETTLRKEARVQERTHALISDIKASPTAPLDPGVAVRLHAHDRVLCDEDPGVCPAPAGGDAAGGR